MLMTLLRSAMDDAQKKIGSITGPIECLIETSKFYELAIIQIDAGLKLVKEQPKDQIPETNRKKMITNLIKLKDMLHNRLNNTKCSIIEKDKLLMERLENAMIMPLGDGIKSEQNVMIEQMKSDIDVLKERFDLMFEQIDQTDQVRPLDQQWRWLIEKETVLITMKGYIDDQRFECSQKDAIIARIIEEQRQSTLQTMAIEEHYMILLNDCHKEFEVYEVETKVREDVFIYVLIEIMNDKRIKLDFELRKIQTEIHIVLKPLLTGFEENVNVKLRTNLSRLDDIKQRIDSLSRLAVSIRNEELVYKKAFTRRCENLLLAETEVDLLGDQVEALQDLLQKIYFVLDQNSSVLSHNFQVMDILKIIKDEFSSKNNFTGLIPDGFGSNFGFLGKKNVLSFNQLSDLISKDLGNMSNLQGTVDLSHNKIKDVNNEEESSPIKFINLMVKHDVVEYNFTCTLYT
ncbi:hypothetical protein L1987_15844 [Smallanthus sonchifolius]|uniref:Uncharacterized protein n=1 Tax=Smallanthus sonchifolius TaxID=185202 RepID=A0ACB9J7I7_9ASTR|nr:hypothetical protein L1987_15844 [Smallanthus sonchifolius]